MVRDLLILAMALAFFLLAIVKKLAQIMFSSLTGSGHILFCKGKKGLMIAQTYQYIWKVNSLNLVSLSPFFFGPD